MLRPDRLPVAPRHGFPAAGAFLLKAGFVGSQCIAVCGFPFYRFSDDKMLAISLI
jgi:hypothetical protein